MYSIFQKELSTYFNSLTGYLAIAVFLVITGLIVWLFPDTSILESGFATLDSFFSVSPYLFMFLIPAITMRLVAGEKADGTYELLRSRPLTLTDIVIGKFLGALSITTLAIIPTIVYFISIYVLAFPLGDIDVGANIGSYIGLFFLASSYVAIGLFCSSLTSNSIIAFLLSVVGCFTFFYGFEAISSLSHSPTLESFLQMLGVKEHYASVSRGVLSIPDLIYFLSITAFFIVLTVGHLGRKFRPIKTTLSYYVFTLLIIGIFNSQLVPSIFGRIDFTEDKRFTLTETSKNMLGNLDKDIYITLFLDGKLPSGFQRLKSAAIDMVKDLDRYAHGRIYLNVIDPLSENYDKTEELTQALMERGLTPTNLSVKTESGYSQKLIFPSAIIATEEYEIPVDLLLPRSGLGHEEVLNNSVQNLEYAFVSGIDKATREEQSFIGFTEGHGEPDDSELYGAMRTLSLNNQVGRIRLDSMDLEGIDRLNVIVVPQPKTPFSESEKYKLDYFVRKGGRILWALDQIDMSLDDLRENGSKPLIGRDLNLDDQLFTYGVRVNYDIVADLNCASIPLRMGSLGEQPQIELVPWAFFPVLIPISNHPIVRNLDGIRSEFIGTLDTVGGMGIEKDIILSSSPFSKIFNPPSHISLQMVEEQPDPKVFNSDPKPVAVLLSGRFDYLYKDRAAPEGIEEPVDLTTISENSKMLVIADGDWLINQVNPQDQSRYPLGWDRYTENQFANNIFLENVIDYLMDDGDMISLRTREVKLRLLDKAKVKDQKTKWQLINIILPTAILLFSGLLQQLYRRYKHGRKAL